jgi:hypothetical protein
VAAVAVAVVATSCGTHQSTEKPSAGDATDDASSQVSPAARLATARKALRDAVSGHYRARAFVDGESEPVVDEQTDFDLDDDSIEVNKDLLDVGSRRHFLVTARETADGQYVQMADWQQWDGCWARLDAKDIARTTGFDIAATPSVPAVVTIVLEAENPTISESDEGLHVVAPADVVLQALEISSRALVPYAKSLDGVTLPVTLTTTAEGLPDTLAVDGEEVADEIDRAGVDMSDEVTKFIRVESVGVKFGAFGDPVHIEAPPDRLLLPDGATKDDTCPANR